MISSSDDVEYEIGPGWLGLATAAVAQLRQLARDYSTTIRIRQVKEKFGALRVSFVVTDGAAKEVDEKATNIALQAERESLRTCEICGRVGSLDQSSYQVMTRCADHKQQRLG